MAGRGSLSRESRRIEAAARRAAADKQLVLAVSGGRDSMALLYAMAHAAPNSVASVATFDHGTGPAAVRAASLVVREARRLGLPVHVRRAEKAGATEAEWREARRAFLEDVARQTGAFVATAHTRDDQVETVLMRVLRDAGARGLAALYASADVVRPLLKFSRNDVAGYAEEVGAPWVEDPTNASMRFLRNRVRRDLLPVLARVHPGVSEELLRLARRASSWRVHVDAVAATLSTVGQGHDTVSAADSALASFSQAELSVLWPAIAARVGLAMDWRGTERAAAFTTRGRVGARIHISGGWEIWREANRFVLRRRDGASELVGLRRLEPDLQWGDWRFVREQALVELSDRWVALLPSSAVLTVRAWHPGDRMRLSDGSLRKVKRFLADAHVSGRRRGLWPVVLADDEIVWIPGVRRSDAAAVRPGRPGVLYRCELDNN